MARGDKSESNNHNRFKWSLEERLCRILSLVNLRFLMYARDLKENVDEGSRFCLRRHVNFHSTL